MQIKMNQWYKFRSIKDKMVFLQKIVPLSEQEKYTDKPLLKIRNVNARIHIYFRRNEYDEYEAIYFENTLGHEQTKILINSVYGAMTKQENLTKQGDTQMLLIEKQELEKTRKLEEERQQLIHDFLSNTESGRIIIQACGLINNQKDIRTTIKWRNVFALEMLTDKEMTEYSMLINELDKRWQDTLDEFTELKELYKLTENYEQKIKLLTDYGIIKGVN